MVSSTPYLTRDPKVRWRLQLKLTRIGPGKPSYKGDVKESVWVGGPVKIDFVGTKAVDLVQQLLTKMKEMPHEPSESDS